MMTDPLTAIIDIRADPRHSGRVEVTLTDRVRLVLAASTALGLTVGQKMTPAALAPLIEEDARHRGLKEALYFLAIRPRSKAEVARKLAAKGVSGENVRRILDRLSRDGYIDDHAFARQWVRHRSRLNPKGRFALRMELRQKGVDDDAIGKALDSVDDQESAMVCLEKNSVGKRTHGTIVKNEMPWVF